MKTIRREPRVGIHAAEIRAAERLVVVKLPTRKISDIWDIDVSDPEFNPIRTKSLIDMCNTHTKVIPAF